MDARALRIVLGLAGGGALLYWLSQQNNAASDLINDAVGIITTGDTVSTLSSYLQGRVPAVAQPYVDDIAQGATGTMPLDFVDPNGGDPALRWALDVASVGQYESAYGTDSGYSPTGDPLGFGDGGNAFGFWQFDKRYHAIFIATDAAQDPSRTVGAQAHYAAGLLAKNWKAFDDVDDPGEREQLMFITYNASLSRVQSLINGGQTVAAADATTTQRYGEGYGQNVVNLVNSLT